MPSLRRTNKFLKRCGALGEKDSADVIEALRQLSNSVSSSGLGIRKLNKKPIKGFSIYEARANDKIRIIFIIDKKCLVLIDVGSHDRVKRTDYSKWHLHNSD